MDTQRTAKKYNLSGSLRKPPRISAVKTKKEFKRKEKPLRFSAVKKDLANHNEKGQRADFYCGNDSKTRYYYNPLNFRLTRLLTTRNTGQDILQDLNYTYDPVGNIVEVVDNAQQIHYFSNSVIEPKGMYTCKALYRLVEDTGNHTRK